MMDNKDSSSFEELLKKGAALYEDSEAAEYRAASERKPAVPSETVTRKKIPLRRIPVFIAAAFLALALAIGGIAGRSDKSAIQTLSLEGDYVVLDVDLNGIKPKADGVSLDFEALEGFSTREAVTEDGERVLYLLSDSEETELTVQELENTTIKLYESSDCVFFNVLLCEKYNCSVAEKNFGKYRESTVIWNDGDYLYSLVIPLEAETALEICESFCL